MAVPLLSLVDSYFNILGTFLKIYANVKKLKKTVDDEINSHILYSLIWSLGAILEEESRLKFSDYIKRMIVGDDVVKDNELELSRPN